MKWCTYIFLLSIVLLGACNLPRSTDGIPILTSTIPVPLSRATETELPAADSQAVASSTFAAPEQRQTRTPTLSPAPTEVTKGEWIAYIGVEENVWLIDPESGEQKQITNDAVRWQPDMDEITATYCCPKWSSDGKYLAFLQQVNSPQESGYSYIQGLWIYSVERGEASILFEADQIPGYDWRPGTHQLAYSLTIDMDYFLGVRQGSTEEYATGIWGIDIHEDIPFELVSPVRGYAILNPNWAPDGRYLGFEEVMGMEGRGLFAFYDFDQDEYQAWDEVIGGYSWSSDSTILAYDRLAYVSVGDERIWVNTIPKGTERAVSPDHGNGYGFGPVFAPVGENLAYLVALQGPESSLYNIIVANLSAVEPIDIGRFANVQSLTWSPNAEMLAFSAGPYDQPEIYTIILGDLDQRVIAEGRQPAWQSHAEYE